MDRNTDWIYKYHNIGLKFEDKVIRVKNDETLRHFMKDEMTAARRLAAFIKSAYRHRFGKELIITRESLAVEIWSHFHLQEVSFYVEHLAENLPFGYLLTKGTDWMILHMEVIDCGERDVDNNRFLWDFLAMKDHLQKLTAYVEQVKEKGTCARQGGDDPFEDF